MPAGIQEIGSDLLLQGYLDMNDNPVLLGLSNQAYIQTSITDSSLDIANDSGSINIQSSSEIILNAPETIISNTLIFNVEPTTENAEDKILVVKADGSVAKREATTLGGNPDVDGITIDYNTAGELEVIQPAKRNWTWTGARNNGNVTNQYIRFINGTPTNQSSYVAAFNSVITAVSAGTNGNETWTAEVRINGAVAYSLNITAADNGFADGLSIPVTAGDKVQFYCNGVGIRFPAITAWLEEV